MSAPFRIRTWREIWTRTQSRGFGWRSLTLVLAGFLALMASNAVSLWAADVLHRQTAAVEQARIVRRSLDRTEQSIIEAVAAERGYLLTGSNSYLQAEADARRASLENFMEAREVVRYDPELLRRLDAARPLLDEGMALTEQVVRDARDGRFTQAVAAIRSGRGNELLREIQSRFDAISEIARARGQESRRAADRARQINLWFGTLGAVLIVLVAALAIFQFSLNFQAIMRAHDELDEANRDLEGRVQARTHDLLAANGEVARARDRAEAMLREVNHRVANSLQLVSSFISLQGRRIKDVEATEAFRATQARIEAVSQVHRRLYTSEDVTTVGLKGYLTSLAHELSQSMGGREPPCTIKVIAGDVETSTDRAVAVGVLVAELVTNAVKYAYPEGAAGEIRIRLVPEEGQRVRLTVEDDGVGMTDGAPAKGTGLGKTIIAAMARDLRTGVDYVYGPSGLVATLVFEL